MELFYLHSTCKHKHRVRTRNVNPFCIRIRIRYANVIQFLFLIRSYLNEMLKGVSTFQVHALLVSFISFSSHFIFYTRESAQTLNDRRNSEKILATHEHINYIKDDDDDCYYCCKSKPN